MGFVANHRCLQGIAVAWSLELRSWESAIYLLLSRFSYFLPSLLHHHLNSPKVSTSYRILYSPQSYLQQIWQTKIKHLTSGPLGTLWAQEEQRERELTTVLMDLSLLEFHLHHRHHSGILIRLHHHKVSDTLLLPLLHPHLTHSHLGSVPMAGQEISGT